jgi:putative alpha-1,2-mannosidase
MIMRNMYGDTPDGLCVNDDCGQMSAWYIFSALGFYPVCPGSDWYAIGSPMVKSAILGFYNDDGLEIITENQSEKNIYIQQVMIDGSTYSKNYIDHATLMNSDIITFVMGPEPQKNWGTISPEEQ